MPVIRTWQLAAGATALGLVIAAGAVAAAGPWESGQREAEREWAAAKTDTDHKAPGPKRPAPAPSAPGVLDPLGGRPASKAADAKPGELGEKLRPLFDDPGLGPLRTASVIDVSTGRRLYGEGADKAMPPASTIKIATAAAALTALGPDHRIPTAVVAAEDRLTLVGGGDASLDGAGLRLLADRTARALKTRGLTSVRLSYDISLYTGNPLHPIGMNGNIAPVTALMVDQGRIDAESAGYAERSHDPAGEAARAFARMLDRRGVRIAAPPAPGHPAAGSRPLTKVLSEPLAALAERMLTDSDNDLAESLARQTALALGEKADFAGGGRAVRAQLSRLRLPLAGARFADGSGLDRKSRVSARLLTALLARAAEPARPELRPVLTGLPVAGFTGTLRTRYDEGDPGSGLIRAKTGTLTGVNALSGTVAAPDGRLLAFAFLAGRTASRDEAQDALDALAAALVS
ncbi:D-alanyl-D-alanine carboxypeptidase [Streptomyces inusitatus]|uniref:D-alanyl-D-alanine carboxypeptidase n=1 Tax=Streptomyces inusitatus TaxID=68221 RepID=A0A918PJA1_9ACTN|nr:D-alanyl-D-alanine carboxypeptidase/D-alanyl-D-alanine-endopeptidase [Streptomyces inusitatus]GGZ12732.1 D-alanyl-D-alanine carboxypeptidase [Streptomyces inusitatus]